MSPIYKRVQYQKQNGFDVPYWDIDTLPALSPSATPSITPTISITPSITPTISITPTNTPTITPTNTPTISITPSITSTPPLSKSPTPTATPTITNTPSITPTNTPTSSPKASATPTLTPTPSATDPCYCKYYSIDNNDKGNTLSVEYVDCDTLNTEILIVPTDTITTQCSCSTPIRVFGSTDYTITLLGACPT